MSKIALEGNASGTGTLTIASQNTNSNYTLTLPNSTGTLVVTGGAQTIEFAAGTAASPSITFTGDTNTGIFSPGADTIAFSEGGVEAMRIDSDGDVGIGTTSPSSKLHVVGSSLTNTLRITDGTNYTICAGYLGSGNVGLISTLGGSASLAFGTDSTERMRIDSSGNVLVKNNAADNNYFQVQGSQGELTLYPPRTGKDFGVLSADVNSGIIFETNGGVERARITSGGDFWVGATSFSNSGSGVNISASNTSGGAAGGLTVLNSASASADSSPALVIMKAMTTTTSAARFVQFYANTSSQAMGGIVGNGATNVQFASLSDIRDKTNIQSISGSLEKINLLRPVEFDWIADGSHINAGFIAQEVETVFPEFVVENMSSDGQEDRKGLTGGMTGGIIAHLVKAIQELKAITDAQATRIEALEAEVAALKGQ